jgi:protocatechuate 3,4-dioxygenase beta subunit
VLGAMTSAEIPADASTPTVEIRLPKPRWLSGRVVDADTGAPVAGAYVGFWREPQTGGESGASATAVSTLDGSFRLPVPVGTIQVSVVRSLHGYLVASAYYQVDRSQPLGKSVEILAAGDIEPLSLPIARGLVIRGIVQRPDGKPVAGAVVQGENIDRPFKHAVTTSDAEGRYELIGLSPHATTIVTVAGEAGAFFRRIDGEPNHPWDKSRIIDLPVRLNAGVALVGRVTFGGQARAGVRMVLTRTFGDEKNRYFGGGEVLTDEQGRYRVAGLLPGDNYMFEIRDPEGMVAPGWTYQSPYGHTVAEGKEVIELPDAQLVSSRQRLRGIVVDPQGNPVADITVSASLAGGRGSLSRQIDAPPPWTKTDSQGRFTLSHLPDEPIELLAYRANPQGGRIFYPAKVQPRLNQDDIRIVFNPKLTAEVEDLDAVAPIAPTKP